MDRGRSCAARDCVRRGPRRRRHGGPRRRGQRAGEAGGGEAGHGGRGEGRGEEGVMNLCRYRSEKFRHYGALLCTGVLHVVDGRALSYFPDWLLANSINFTRHSSTKVGSK